MPSRASAPRRSTASARVQDLQRGGLFRKIEQRAVEQVVVAADQAQRLRRWSRARPSARPAPPAGNASHSWARRGRWITTAIAGDSAASTMGTAIASPRMRRRSGRAIVTCADDNSTTGNSVMLPIDHSDTISSWAATAAAIGSRSGKQERQQHQAPLGLGAATRCPRPRSRPGAPPSRRSAWEPPDSRPRPPHSPIPTAARAQAVAAMGLHRIVECLEVVGIEPGQMGREPGHAGRDRQPRRRRAQIGAAPRIGERRDCRARAGERSTSICQAWRRPPPVRPVPRRSGCASQTSAGTTRWSAPTAASSPCWR